MRISSTGQRIAGIESGKRAAAAVSPERRALEERRPALLRQVCQQGCHVCVMETFGKSRQPALRNGGSEMGCAVLFHAEERGYELTREEQERGDLCPLRQLYADVFALKVTRLKEAEVAALRPSWRGSRPQRPAAAPEPELTAALLLGATVPEPETEPAAEPAAEAKTPRKGGGKVKDEEVRGGEDL